MAGFRELNTVFHGLTFADFTEEALSDYARGGLRPTSDGKFTLVFPPEWEAHNFSKTPYVWDALARVGVPTLMLPAEHSYLCGEAVLGRHRHRFSSSVTVSKFPTRSWS